MNKKQLGNIKLFPELEESIEYYIRDQEYRIHIFQCPVCMRTHICSGWLPEYYWCEGINIWDEEEDLLYGTKRENILKVHKEDIKYYKEEENMDPIHTLRRMYKANLDLTKDIEKYYG